MGRFDQLITTRTTPRPKAAAVPSAELSESVRALSLEMAQLSERKQQEAAASKKCVEPERDGRCLVGNVPAGGCFRRLDGSIWMMTRPLVCEANRLGENPGTRRLPATERVTPLSLAEANKLIAAQE